MIDRSMKIKDYSDDIMQKTLEIISRSIEHYILKLISQKKTRVLLNDVNLFGLTKTNELIIVVE
jgi:hypothetical protein